MKRHELHYYEMKLEEIVGQASRLVDMMSDLLEGMYLDQENVTCTPLNIEDLF